MDFIGGIISSISGYMYSYILIALLIAAGLYFSFRTRFVQIRLLGESIRVIAEPKKDKDSISSFQALMVSTASRVGTGNIVGVTGAIIAGGPGAVFWMWLIALLGGASAFVESTLAQIYKKERHRRLLRRTRLLHKTSSQSSGFRRSIRSISDTYLYGRIQCPCFIQPYGLRQSVYPFRKCFSDHRRSSSRSFRHSHIRRRKANFQGDSDHGTYHGHRLYRSRPDSHDT